VGSARTVSQAGYVGSVHGLCRSWEQRPARHAGSALHPTLIQILLDKNVTTKRIVLLMSIVSPWYFVTIICMYYFNISRTLSNSFYKNTKNNIQKGIFGRNRGK
jgi:hypothetical protein